MSYFNTFFGNVKPMLALVAITFGFGMTQSVEASYPDLKIQAFQLTGTPQYVGNELRIPLCFQVINDGPVNASGDFINGIRLNGTFKWSQVMNSLAGNGSTKVVNAVFKIHDPNKLLKGRTVALVAFADAHITAPAIPLPNYARIQESSEYNNQGYLSVNIPGGLGYKAPVQGQGNGLGNGRGPQQLQPQQSQPQNSVPTQRFPSTRVPSTRVPSTRVPTNVPATRAPTTRTPMPVPMTKSPSRFPTRKPTR